MHIGDIMQNNGLLNSKRSIQETINDGQSVSLKEADLSLHGVLHTHEKQIIKLNKNTILSQFMFHLKDRCINISFNNEQAKRFAFKPRMLSQRIYGNVEMYSLILRLNNMHSVTDFTEEKLIDGIVVPNASSIRNFLNEVLVKDKNEVNRNREKVNSDVNSMR